MISNLVRNLTFLLVILTINPALSLTLEEAYQLAVKQNENVLISKSDLAQAELATQLKTAEFLPQINAVASHQIQDEIISNSGEKSSTTSRLTLSQSLFAGGADKHKLQSAKLFQKSQEYSLEETKKNLYLSVAQAFYQVLSSEKELENNQKSLDLTRKRISELQRRVKIGRSRSVEILTASTQESILKSQLQISMNQTQSAKLNLSQLIGLEKLPELKEATNILLEAEQLKKTNLHQNDPEIKKLTALLESTESEALASKSEHYPSLDLSSNYYLSRSGEANGPKWDVGLVLTIPIFAGGSTKAQAQINTEKKTQAQLKLEQRKKNLDLEVQTLSNNLVSLAEQIKSLESALKTSEKNYTEIERDYRFSLATNLEVIQALNTYQDSKRNFDRTQYEALLTFALLKSITGKLKL